MKKLIFLLFLLPSLAFAQTNISKWWKATPTADASIPTLTNGMWYYSSDSSHFTFYQNGHYAHLGSGTGTFAGLTDGPGALTSHGLNYTRVNSGATALEYRTSSQVLSDISGVPTSRQLTINGTAFDLTADRTWTITNVTGSAGTLSPGRNINGVLFDGSSNISVNLNNALTVDNSSIQLNTGTTFDGSAARTISIKNAGVTNSMLANSAITVNGNSTSLGSSVTITTTGTTNRVSVTGGTGLTPTIDISASYVGQSSITTLGTIATGIWNGTRLTNAYTPQGSGLSVWGVTGSSTADQASIVGTANQVLRINGAGTSNGFGSIDISQSATVGASILKIANGGSNNSTFTSGSTLYYDGTKFNEDNNNFYWNAASHILSVNTGGDQSGTDAINAYGQIDAYFPNSSQGAITTSGGTSGFTASSSRGTGTSPSNLSANDLVGGFSMWGYTNSAYTNVAGAFGYVTGSTSTNLGGEYRIYTKADGGALTQRFTVDNAGGIQIVSANLLSTWSGTPTATANNQNFITVSPAIISRNTPSDNLDLFHIGGSITAGSTGINGSIVNIATAFKTNSGIITGTSGIQAGSASPNDVYVSKTLSGMTITTFTSVAPASTSGSGTGALFTVVVNTATTLTSITCTTSGSGYNVGETITFNGSQFGGSGSIVLAILATNNSFGTSESALTIMNPYADYSGITVPYLNLVGTDGSSKFSIKSVYTGTAAANTNGVQFAVNGTSTFTLFANSISLGGSTITSSGTTTFNGTSNFATFVNTGTMTSTGTYRGSTSSAALTFSGSPEVSAPAQLRSNVYATNGVQLGVPSIATGVSFTISNAGSGYSNASGIFPTGGTGNNLQVITTTSGGSLTSVIVNSNAQRGRGYTTGDVLSIPGGTGGTITVGAVDQFGGVVSVVTDNRSLTDATSNNSYISLHSTPTYVLTGSSASTWFGYYNPTYTSFGTGTKGGIAIIPSGTLSTIGGSTFDATWKIIGNGSNPTLKTVGAGTGTNYSIQSFQSNGSTQIFGLQDNGNATFNNGNLTLGTAGNKLFITEGSNGTVGQTTLVSGTKAITVTGTTTSSRCFVQLVTPSGTSLTTTYQCACTSNTVTLQANVAAGTINTADVSTLNYWIVN